MEVGARFCYKNMRDCFMFSENEGDLRNYNIKAPC